MIVLNVPQQMIILIKSPNFQNFPSISSSRGLDELEAALQNAELEGAPLCKVGEEKVTDATHNFGRDVLGWWYGITLLFFFGWIFLDISLTSWERFPFGPYF